ncbi:hypothetical protein T03_14870 [Trichinella britovi]|uniref:Uncharacterized protein n=1 Tax=Trichinella britovi TaxID=45882 RepID=A0A0V1CV34_TRIBR|nr:hypothetical protein T03_14870 [Trichinella britovi]
MVLRLRTITEVPYFIASEKETYLREFKTFKSLVIEQLKRELKESELKIKHFTCGLPSLAEAMITFAHAGMAVARHTFVANASASITTNRDHKSSDAHCENDVTVAPILADQ